MKNQISVICQRCFSILGISLLIAVCVLSLHGCANLPDLSGYTAATDQLRRSIKSAGDSVATEIDLVSLMFEESDGDKSTIETLGDAKKDFLKHWEYRNNAMTAIVSYAGSLQEITNAGKEGNESAKALGDSIKGLLNTIGIVPGTQITGVLAETVEFLYGEIAQVKAQGSLEKSLRRTGPIMEKLVEIIEKDTIKIKTTFEIALNAQKEQLRRNSEPVRVGGERDDLIKLRKYRNMALVEELQKEDSKQDSQKIKNLTQDLSVIEGRLTNLNPEWSNYRNELQKLQKRQRVGLCLIQASSKALGVWKNAHVKLAEAVGKKKSPSLHEVIIASNDIQALIKKWGEI